MRRLVVTQNITLDGVVEMVTDWFTPEGGDDESDVLEMIREQTATETALLLGRRTFEDFRGYWPQQVDDTTGITAHLDRVPKYVTSRTLGDPGWQNSTVLPGPLVEEVGALKDSDGGEIGITGSISVVHELVRAGLVEEYRLFVFPVVLGRGRRLFPEGAEVAGLRLQDVRSFRSGVALMTYTTT